jgi:hypothetical protein
MAMTALAPSYWGVRSSGFVARMWGMLAVSFVAAVLLITASVECALAGKPVRGATYRGHLKTGNPSPPSITFDVSGNGAEVRNVRVTYPPLLCALGGMTPPQRPAAPTPISRRGVFVQTVDFATPAAKVFATIRISGRFRIHRRVTGKARVRWIGGFGPGCGGTVRYLARAG